jgi:hypothetical protein
MSTSLARLRPLHELGHELGHVFPSPSSMAWFVRQNKPRLVAEGGLVKVANRWLATSKFDDVVLAIGESAAAKGGA